MKEKPLWKEPLAILFGSQIISVFLAIIFSLIQHKLFTAIFGVASFVITILIICYGAHLYGESFR